MFCSPFRCFGFLFPTHVVSGLTSPLLDRDELGFQLFDASLKALHLVLELMNALDGGAQNDVDALVGQPLQLIDREGKKLLATTNPLQLVA